MINRQVLVSVHDEACRLLKMSGAFKGTAAMTKACQSTEIYFLCLDQLVENGDLIGLGNPNDARQQGNIYTAGPNLPKYLYE